MREYLFTGKRRCDGKWIEGDLSYHVHDGDAYIFSKDGYDSVDRYEVNPETVCQYTGLNDSTTWDELSENEKEKFLSEWNDKENRQNIKEDWNGRKIFEGNIISFIHTKWINEDDGFPVMDNFKKYTRNYAVEFVNTYCTYGLRARNKSIHFMLSQATTNAHNAKVIGNIFDNLELLKGGKLNG